MRYIRNPYMKKDFEQHSLFIEPKRPEKAPQAKTTQQKKKTGNTQAKTGQQTKSKPSYTEQQTTETAKLKTEQREKANTGEKKQATALANHKLQ